MLWRLLVLLLVLPPVPILCLLSTGPHSPPTLTFKLSQTSPFPPALLPPSLCPSRKLSLPTSSAPPSLSPLPLQLVESRCLAGTGPPSSRFPVNSAVVREYLTGLLKSGRLAEYGDGPDAAPPLPGRSHRSLALLLAELRAAAAGEAAPPAPGAAVSTPLHVVVQVGCPQSPQFPTQSFLGGPLLVPGLRPCMWWCRWAAPCSFSHAGGSFFLAWRSPA